ncbi:hypothetical protein NX862_17915 [Rhodobacter sp. KR11]|uniref:hypothetical protein n=1 Tax=Rhodobacter sp. KR11 TaxID=2974588 RepID=UPI002221DC8A|nr:hypothetical protein [Rhodobacter sp. KR11]MCW1920636.1 hypothetical protein [Rhodobacter sp. KR11]
MGKPKNEEPGLARDEDGHWQKIDERSGRFMSVRDDGKPYQSKPASGASVATAKVLKGASQTHRDALIRLKDR